MITHHNVDQVGDGVDERPGPALAVGLRVDGAGQTPRALLGVHLHKMKGPKQVLRAATLWEKGVPLEQLPKINSRAGNRFFFVGPICPTIACGPAAPLLDAAGDDGVLCQVTEVFEKNNPARAIRAKWKKNKGFACAMVISQLNGRVLSKIREWR